MDFSQGTWWLVATLIAAAIGVIAYFLRRTITKQDEHDKDIGKIKLTYVTKSELADTKSDLRGEIAQLRDDIKDLKDTSLSRADFFRSQSATDSKIDKLTDMIITIIKEDKNRGE